MQKYEMVFSKQTCSKMEYLRNINIGFRSKKRLIDFASLLDLHQLFYITNFFFMLPLNFPVSACIPW